MHQDYEDSLFDEVTELREKLRQTDFSSNLLTWTAMVAGMSGLVLFFVNNWLIEENAELRASLAKLWATHNWSANSQDHSWSNIRAGLTEAENRNLVINILEDHVAKLRREGTGETTNPQK